MDSSGSLATLFAARSLQGGAFNTASGPDGLILAAQAIGMDACVSGNANFVPELVVGIVRAAKRGDLDAARAAGAWFFPIVPRYEAESWSRLSYEGWPLFAAGCYNREYQNRLLDEFFGKLPVRAPWEEQNSLRRVS